MTYVKTNVLKPGDNAGAGGNKKDLVILFDMDDVLTFPDRDSKGIVVNDNIVLKPGAYMLKMYATVTSIVGGANSEGDIDAQGFVQNLAFDHPGSDNIIREFVQNMISKNFGAIVQKCGVAQMDLYGTPCAPLNLTTKWEDTKDKNIHNLAFKSMKSPYSVAIYNGTVGFDTVTGTIPADEDTPNLANGPGQYQLTNGTVAAITIAETTGAVHGGLYTFLGSGGTHPSLITGNTHFFMVANHPWTALAGSSITFKAFMQGPDAMMMEQSRS